MLLQLRFHCLPLDLLSSMGTVNCFNYQWRAFRECISFCLLWYIAISCCNEVIIRIDSRHYFEKTRRRNSAGFLEASALWGSFVERMLFPRKDDPVVISFFELGARGLRQKFVNCFGGRPLSSRLYESLPFRSGYCKHFVRTRRLWYHFWVWAVTACEAETVERPDFHGKKAEIVFSNMQGLWLL